VNNGNATYANQAKQILNGYANNFQRYDVAAGPSGPTEFRQTYLEAAWVTPSFVAAAEIIRYYQVGGTGAGWSSTEVSKFSAFLNNLKDNYVNNVPGAVTTINNWQASYCYAKMALGVWFNSNTVYASGYDYLKLHLSDFIRSDGNVTECGRDCHHLQYTLTALTHAAETARIQGGSAVYGLNTSVIKQGWTKYEESLQGSTQCLSCQNAADNAVYPGIETASNYYGSNPLAALRDRADPYGVPSDKTFLGLTSFTHRGIGTVRERCRDATLRVSTSFSQTSYLNSMPLRFLTLLLCLLLAAPASRAAAPNKQLARKAVRALRRHILAEAAWALQQQPETVTASTSPRSAGGPHDFFSEGDYWWPDPQNPAGPYVQRDGQTNPTNFTAHRLSMIRFSRVVGALASAYKLTGDEKYVRHALVHLRAWFLDPATLMNPSLLYAQAIQGRFTGRGIGIIDTIQLLEVAQGVLVMQAAGSFAPADLAGIRSWFAQYLTWLTNHQYGQDEMNAANNHGTCWTMQVAAFARLTGNQELLGFCRTRYKTVLLPTQMAANGSFPLELKRTKPYGYSLFNLDAMAMLCAILSTEQDNLWAYQTPDGRTIQRGIDYMYPYVADKSAWAFPHDVMYWDNWPVAQPALVLGAVQFGRPAWLATWQRLDHAPEVAEVVRNLPVRNPILWLDGAAIR
jgi:hypothetical protein